MKPTFQFMIMKKTAFLMACLLTAATAMADSHWVGTWGTAPQLVENNNNPPFLEYWSQDALNQGYVYVVDFAGYAK